MTRGIEFGVTEREANCRAIGELKSVAWACPLLEEIQMRGGFKAPASFLFELRLAAEIHRAGRSATYEFQTGVGLTSVDFRLGCHLDWLIELLRPEPHSRSDEESQMLKFAGILSDKVCTKHGLPSKFPRSEARSISPRNSGCSRLSLRDGRCIGLEAKLPTAQTP